MVEGFKTNYYPFIYDEINVNYITNEVIYNTLFDKNQTSHKSLKEFLIWIIYFYHQPC